MSFQSEQVFDPSHEFHQTVSLIFELRFAYQLQTHALSVLYANSSVSFICSLLTAVTIISTHGRQSNEQNIHEKYLLVHWYIQIILLESGHFFFTIIVSILTKI